MSKSKRILVSLTPDQYSLLQSLKGELGSDDAEVIRNIILAWLAEKSILSSYTKDKIKNIRRTME